ncbi:Ribosomal-protein-S18p-alanine acetyltransferase [Richelia intracellularis HM01]|nr:Ribosomal-protein-S18p-alanine acetyltransferase [Richelia intracellularis HM01]
MNTFNLKLKLLTTKNLYEIVALDKICFGGLWSWETYQKELDSSNCKLLGIFSNSYSEYLLAMGCFWAILEEAHITILAVNPQYQRQGLGQTLLYFFAQGCG